MPTMDAHRPNILLFAIHNLQLHMENPVMDESHGLGLLCLRMKEKREKGTNIENVNFEGVCLARVLFSLILWAFWAHQKQFSRPLSMCYRYQQKVCEQNHLVLGTFDGYLEQSRLSLAFQMEKHLPLVISGLNGISYIKRLNRQGLEITFLQSNPFTLLSAEEYLPTE